MKQHFKRVTVLGLGLAVSGGLLAACEPASAPSESASSETQQAENAQTHGHAHDQSTAQEPATSVGEGGEGEGGVVVEDAGSDPVVFVSALAVAEAHVIAARDAHAVGEVESAGEMFAHPASEVLFDMEDTFQAQGVEPFEALFLDASSAVFNGETHEQIVTRSDEIIATLRQAAERAPDDGSTLTQIQAGVAADQIDRAVDMYRIAQDSEQYGPYLDGYGFYKAGLAAFQSQEAEIEASNPEAAARLRAALALLAQAYPSAEPQDAYPLDRFELNTASTQASLAVMR